MMLVQHESDRMLHVARFCLAVEGIKTWRHEVKLGIAFYPFAGDKPFVG